jgi:hypothetical protein
MGNFGAPERGADSSRSGRTDGTYQRSCPLEAQLLSSWIQPTALFGSWASWPVEMLHHSLRLLVMASAPDCG